MAMRFTHNLRFKGTRGVEKTFSQCELKLADRNRFNSFANREARANAAADQIRVHHQPKNREADRPDDSAEFAGAGGQSHKMTF
jgi:hypothetical protein